MSHAFSIAIRTQAPLSKVMLYQSVGFLTIIVLAMLDELIALPSLIMGHHPYIHDFRESALKMLLILAVWFLVSGSTRRLLARVCYLEGFMHMCAWCHHIHHKGHWMPLEEFLQKGFDTATTHGICPICRAKQNAMMEQVKKSAAKCNDPTNKPSPKQA